jgi:hypothetical protein
MTNEQKEIKVKTKLLNTLRPLFEKNPSLVWAMTEEEISAVLYSYVNKIFNDLKDDLN